MEEATRISRFFNVPHHTTQIAIEGLGFDEEIEQSLNLPLKEVENKLE